MPIPTRLSRKLHQTLGEEAAEDLVNWMQQVDAQRAELRELNELNFSRFDVRLSQVALRLNDLRAELAELRQEGTAGLAALRQELRQEMKETNQGLTDLGKDIAQMEARLERRIGDLIKWSFVFWVGAVGAIAMLAGVLR